MNRTKALTLAGAALAAAALVGMAAPASAQDATAASPVVAPATTPMPAPVATADEDAWQFGLNVPLWAPQLDGNITVLGQTMDVNVPFSEIVEHLDASFALGLKAQKGRFGMFGSFAYMKFSGGFNDKLGGSISSDLKFVVVNAGVSYLLLKTGEDHPFTLTGTAGVRYWFVSTDIDRYNRFGNLDLHGYAKWDLFDPVIGLRASQYITQKLHLDLAGDGGGFNLNHETDWTWSASGMLTYDFCKRFSASAGYQLLALNESAGSGLNQKGADLVFSGVAANLTFKF
jgi:hypothetical protein